MNNSRYYEFNIQPKNAKVEERVMNVLKIFKILTFILAGCLAFLAFMFFNFMWIFAFIVLILGFVLLFFQYRFNNYYDLIFVDGQISIVKVINNVRRKALKRFSTKSINVIGFAGGETYERNIKNKQVKKYIITNVVTDKDVCILCGEEDKFMIVIPYDDKFLSCIMRFVGSVKFEKGFLSSIKNV